MSLNNNCLGTTSGCGTSHLQCTSSCHEPELIPDPLGGNSYWSSRRVPANTDGSGISLE